MRDGRNVGVEERGDPHGLVRPELPLSVDDAGQRPLRDAGRLGHALLRPPQRFQPLSKPGLSHKDEFALIARLGQAPFAVIAMEGGARVRYALRMDADFFKKRLKKLHKTQEGWAAALGLTGPQISRLLKGDRRLQVDEVGPTAEYFETRPSTVMLHTGATWAKPLRLVVNHIVAEGGIVRRLDPTHLPGNLEEIEVSEELADAEAGRVMDNSMEPAIRRGNHVVWRRVPFEAADELYTSEVVAQLAGGPLVLAILRPGTEPGRFTLMPIRQDGAIYPNAQVEWLAEVLWIKRSKPAEE